MPVTNASQAQHTYRVLIPVIRPAQVGHHILMDYKVPLSDSNDNSFDRGSSSDFTMRPYEETQRGDEPQSSATPRTDAQNSSTTSQAEATVEDVPQNDLGHGSLQEDGHCVLRHCKRTNPAEPRHRARISSRTKIQSHRHKPW